MLALVFEGQAALRSDYPQPAPGEGEALLAVHAAGVCSTDLEILKGYMDFRGVMGHEFVGLVVEGPKQWVGKRMVAEINCPCGTCETCRRGILGMCDNLAPIGYQFDGAFAEFMAVPPVAVRMLCVNAVPDVCLYFVKYNQ